MMPYRHEIPRLEQYRASVGVLSVIYHPGAKSVLLIEERNSKEATNKYAGEVSFPIETRKNNENPATNLLASLTEIFDDTDKEHFGDHLHLSSFSQKMFHLPNNVEVPVDVALFLYDGPLFIPTPVTKDEVKQYGWIPVDQLERLPLRSLTREALIHLQTDDMLSQAETTFALHHTIRRQLRQEYFSLAQFHINREQSKDIVIQKGGN